MTNKAGLPTGESKIMSGDDYAWMSRALQLAEKGRYTARPNPCVGCVIVKQGRLIAEGWHYRAGEGHAEVVALANASESVLGATVYVTLEPCNHQGRTGPCSQALVAAGVERVVFAMVDPNPQVAGQGLNTLQAAGIQVDGPLLEAQALELNRGFVSRMSTQRPYVRCKLATSIDGRTAMASGESQWITGAAARSDVQRWRARSSAIVTGIGSVLQDNSRLTLRADELPLENVDDVLARPPLRVLLDSQLRVDASAAILQGSAPTVIVTSEQAAADKVSYKQKLESIGHCSVMVVPSNDDGLDISAVLKALAQDYECNDILLEAGAQLVGGFFKANVIDEWLIYQAPVLLGAQARPLVDWSIESMMEKTQLEILERRLVGEDLRIIAKVKK